MTVQDDLSTSYTLYEEVEDVTLSPRVTGSPDASVKAKRRVATKNDYTFAANLGITTEIIVWHLWASTMGSLVPRPDDTITDSDTVDYTIRSVQKMSLGQRYRCMCTVER